MSSIRPNRVEVVTSVQRRRRWTPEQKLEIVKQSNETGSPGLFHSRYSQKLADFVISLW
jgi:transposase-like protein